MTQTRIIPGYPALMIESGKKSLVITDLHLGFENTLSLNNVFLGKNKTVTEITKEIELIIDKTKPDSLILLGDVKSGINSITKVEWETVPAFFENITILDFFFSLSNFLKKIKHPIQGGLMVNLTNLCSLFLTNHINRLYTIEGVVYITF